MALLSLGDRLRYELEEIVCRTPSAKERCRAQALLWLAEGSGIEEVAELLHVSRQTVPLIPDEQYRKEAGIRQL